MSVQPEPGASQSARSRLDTWLQHLPPRWVVAVSFAVAAAILGDSLLYAVLPTEWPHLGLELGMVGLLLSANRFVRLVSNPLAGWVMARTGVRLPFLIAVFAAAGTTAAYAAGLGFAVFLVARGLWGVCWSFLRLGGQLAALEAADDRQRGYYLGFFNGVTRFGSFVAVLLGGLLTDLVGFHTTIAIFVVLNLLGGLAVIRERPPQQRHRIQTRPAAPTQSTALPPSPPSHAPVMPYHDRLRLWLVYAAVFLHGLAVSGLITATLGLWLLSRYGQTTEVFFLTLGVATLTGTLLGARFLADFLWGPVAGHLSDRYGRLHLLLTAGAIQIVAILWLSATDHLLGTVLAALLLFLAAPALQVTLDATVGDLTTPAQRARAFGWYATWLDLGAAVGPLAGYLLAAGLGLDWLYRASALLLLLIGVAYLASFRASTR